MFNGKGYSLSDIAAVSGNARNGDGGWFGGDGAWWIILLFMFAGWGGNGWGGNGAGSTRDAVSYGFDMNGLENGIRGLEHGLCDGFYELNTGLLTGFGNTNMAAMQNTNTITAQLSNMAAQSAASRALPAPPPPHPPPLPQPQNKKSKIIHQPFPSPKKPSPLRAPPLTAAISDKL